MNKLNSLIIEGEVIEFDEDYIILAYERKTQNAISFYHFKVQCNARLIKVGQQIRVVGRLQQNIFNDEVIIVAEHIEVVNKEEKEFISNE